LPIRGLTHRQLLPLYPRARNPGARYYESTIKYEMPRTQRTQIDVKIPKGRASSCEPVLSGITSYLNERVRCVTDQTNAANWPEADDKPVWNPGAGQAQLEHQIKRDLLAVMQKVKSASLFFTDDTPAQNQGDGGSAKKCTHKPKQDKRLAGPKMTGAALEQRLEHYRCKPEAFNQLRKNVLVSLREASYGVDNVIQRNIQSMHTKTPAGRATAFQEQLDKLALKATAVQEHKHKQMLEETAYRNAVEESQEAKRRRANYAIESKFKQATHMRRERFESRWLILSAWGGRGQKMLKAMLESRPMRDKLKITTAAARTLQNWYRPLYWRRKGKRIRSGLRRLKILIRTYHAGWVVRRVDNAAKVLLTFLKEMNAQNEFVTACKNFCCKVKKSQKMWRKYKTWKDFVIDTRREKFMQAEARVGDDWERKKLKIEDALAKATPADDPDDIIGNFNMRRPPPKISEAIAEQLLLESFRDDQKRMMVDLGEYENAVKAYEIKRGSWEALQDAKRMMMSERDKKKMKIDPNDPPPPRPARPIITPWVTDEVNWMLIKKGHQRMEFGM